MAVLTVFKPGLTAAALPAGQAAASGGDSIPNDSKTMLRFLNTNAAARNVTIDSKVACNQGTDHNIVVNVPATTGDVWVGPFDKSRFDNASGQLDLTYDAVTNLSVFPMSAGG